ncbi:MAG: UDP-N-acetylmuramoyl-L-alanine--D-glutamate ligase [Candidatus Levybacteria bacterium CG10_big_fil_rev_8_21_14_0_10_35_13]|nr:MAG: UDP-N-acetylmuramoyl-L-alanine--D-glutamate ligase [Candidatus Levybacteria bacterium CG10_big_fil_rev_8_21_14_0_10_35_13]
MDFKNKNIAVIGGGVEGLSSAKYLKNKGAHVTILDRKDSKDYLKGLDKYDLIVRSPGVKISELIIHNSELIISKVTSQTRLFFELCPAKIIGVTGTKGKGTTSTLIYEMLKKQGFDAYLGGNIGVPPFEFLDKLNTQAIVVLELSSFQLEDLTRSPQIAVILMITSEHLAPSEWQKNFHKNLEKYVDAKRNILKFQTEKDFAVINKDYISSRESDVEANGKIYFVSTEDECGSGCFVRQNSIWIKDPSASVRHAQDKSSGQVAFEERVIDTKEILIPGAHNLENVCAASMAAYLAGVSIANIAYVLKNFKGLEHRLELFATINGVKYYDDSISTIPESAIVAIKAFKDPKILILGGITEGSSFDELGRLIAGEQSIKAIIGIGKEWPNIKKAIEKYSPASQILFLEGATSMSQIVAAASKIAIPEDIVLLSPACKSFDMFKNYKDRGDQFKHFVLKLKS